MLELQKWSKIWPAKSINHPSSLLGTVLNLVKQQEGLESCHKRSLTAPSWQAPDVPNEQQFILVLLQLFVKLSADRKLELAYIGCQQSGHWLSADRTLAVSWSYIGCQLNLHLLPAESAFTVQRSVHLLSTERTSTAKCQLKLTLAVSWAYICCQLRDHFLSAERPFAVSWANICCQLSLHLQSAEPTFSVSWAYICCQLSVIYCQLSVHRLSSNQTLELIVNWSWPYTCCQQRVFCCQLSIPASWANIRCQLSIPASWLSTLVDMLRTRLTGRGRLAAASPLLADCMEGKNYISNYRYSTTVPVVGWKTWTRTTTSITDEILRYISGWPKKRERF